MRAAFAVVVSAGLAALPVRAPAQTGYSVEIGTVTAFEDALIQLGFRATPALAGRGGVDVAAAVFPDALADGVFFSMLDLDLTFGTRLAEDAILYPRFGASALVRAGGDGGGGVFGYNLGAGVLARTSPALGVRIDYTHRRFTSGGETVPFSSISFGIVWIH